MHHISGSDFSDLPKKPRSEMSKTNLKTPLPHVNTPLPKRTDYYVAKSSDESDLVELDHSGLKCKFCCVLVT